MNYGDFQGGFHLSHPPCCFSPFMFLCIYNPHNHYCTLSWLNSETGLAFHIIMSQMKLITNQFKERKSVLCVGLVCLDLVTVVDKFPKEDTDMRSSAQYKVTSPPTTLTKSLLKGNTPLSRSVEGTRTTAAGFSQSLVSQPPSSAALLVRCTLHHLPAPGSTLSFEPSCIL